MVTQRTVMPRRLLVCAALAAAGGCDAPIGHPPIARIDLTPAAIPAHDEFQTVVMVDGTRSGDPIDDPGATRPLAFQWEIVDAEHRFESGSRETSKQPALRFRG